MRFSLPAIAFGLATSILFQAAALASSPSSPAVITLPSKEGESPKSPASGANASGSGVTAEVSPTSRPASNGTGRATSASRPRPQPAASTAAQATDRPAASSTGSSTSTARASSQQSATSSGANRASSNRAASRRSVSRTANQATNRPPAASTPPGAAALRPATPSSQSTATRNRTAIAQNNAPTTPAPATPAPVNAPAVPAQSEPVRQIQPPIPSQPIPQRISPEYLDSNPNPLLFPTRPEEVQIVGTQPLTLQQVLELAQRNSRELQQSQLELEQRRLQLREAQAANFPDLQVGAGLTGSQNQQEDTVVQTPTGPQTIDAGGDVLFGLTGNVQLSYDIFTGGQRSGTIGAAERQVRFQELEVERIAEQLRLDVTDEYYDIQQRDEEVRIARSTVEENERSLRDAQAQERAGVGTRFDVLQAQVDLANAQQQLTDSLSQQRIARRQLVQRLSLSENVTISAADPVEVVDRWNLTLEESIVLAYRNRAELEQQLVQREISEQRRRVALSALQPRVSTFAEYSVSGLLNGPENNDDFEDDYRFGVQVNLNVFDGGEARARARQEEVNAQLAESQFGQLRNQVRFQVEQAYLTLQSSAANIATTELAVAQATEALRLARLRFQAGVGTQSDVLRSQTALTRAEVDRLRAILGYNRAISQLQRFVSNLPEGNLAETP